MVNSLTQLLLSLPKTPFFTASLVILITAFVVKIVGSLKRKEDQNRVQSETEEKRGKWREKDSEDDDEDCSELSALWPEHLEHVKYEGLGYQVEETLRKSEEFFRIADHRRSLRFFSPEDVPKNVVENIIRSAGTSPSGAHTEPWTYVAVKDASIKEVIRQVVEAEEEENYKKRMGRQWVNDLKGLRTTWNKPYITEAPWIILVFKQLYTPLPDNQRRTHYYHEISTSISVGIFLLAVEYAGLVTLTSTPLNCGPAIRKLLGRPSHEKLVFLMPLGYPDPDATVPKLPRKPIEEIAVFVE